MSGLFGLVMAMGLHGQSVVLYDVDYTGRGDQVGQEIATGQGDFPGRTMATEILSGEVTIEDGSPGWSGTVARMVAVKQSPTSTSAYSQHSYWLFGGGVYVFRKNRIEMEFKFGSPELLAADEGLRISTFGGVTNWLEFRPGGEVVLNANDLDPGTGTTSSSESVAGVFDRTQPVQVVWEFDGEAGTTTVTVNGVAVERSGLGVSSSGIRNYLLYPAPWQVVMRFSDLDSQSSLDLRSFRVVGCGYDGPLFHTAGDPLSSFDLDQVVLPLELPATGIWQPQFSLDMEDWVAFGVPLSAPVFFDSVLCGKVGEQGMYVRLVEVE